MMIRATLVALALVATACVTEESGGTPAPGDHFVPVTLTEHAIEMPESAPAGEVSFEITNEGDTDHSFVVEGEAVDEQLRVEVRPGATEILDVELEPGTYTVWCPIGDHRERGMEAEIEITEARDDADAPLRDEAVDPSEEQDEIGDD